MTLVAAGGFHCYFAFIRLDECNKQVGDQELRATKQDNTMIKNTR